MTQSKPSAPRSMFQAVPALSLVTCLMLASHGNAQSAPGFVGLTANTPLTVSTDTATCVQTQCTPAGMTPPAAGQPWVGGTAYDPNTRGVWVSNGLLIGKYDVRNACVPQCPVQPMPNTSPNNPVTGLAYHAPSNTLYVTDLSGIIRWYTVGGGCQLSLVGRCIAPIPANSILTGCATDDWTGQIFYTAIVPGNPGGTVYVAQIGSPCTPFCQFNVTTCGTNSMMPLTGIGYDLCAQRIWVTDGRFTKGISFNPITCTVIGEIQCCVNTIERMIGLTVLSSTETSIGTSCTAPPCPACPMMLHSLGGDPYIGSTSFNLNLTAAPGGSNAILFLNAGPCGPPILSPPFCAGVVVPIIPPPLSAGGPTGGTVGMCNGSRSVMLPIPANPSLCGLVLCTQYLGICPTGGLFTSNALQWVIGGS